MPIVRKRKGRTMSPTNKRKKVLNENSSESNSEVKVENEFDNLFEEEADLTIKEDLQDIKLDLFNDLNNFGNDSSSKSDNTSNGNHKVSTSLKNGKNRSSNFRNSAKITKIINNQKEAFKLIQSALVKFENVTKELQEMLEIDIEEEQADDLLLQNDLDPSFDSFQITEVEGESSHYFQNSSENGLKNDLDSSINSFQITEVEGESSHYWQNSSEKSAAYSQTQEDEIQEKTKECYSKEVPSNVSDKLINHSDKNLESSSSQFSETQEKHKNHVSERSQKTKICVSKPNSSSKLPYVLLRKIDDVNTTISPTPEIGIEHGAKTNFSQNARERVRSTPLNEEECTVNKEIVQNLQIARQSESDSQMDSEIDSRMGASDLDILASILEEHNNTSGSKDIKKNRFRPCPYCGVQQTKLTRHITLIHKNEPEVMDIMSHSKEKRVAMFVLLKKRGIVKANEESLKRTGKLRFMERKSKGGPYVKCSGCGGFYKKYSFKRHLRRCKESSSDRSPIHYIPLNDRSFEDSEFNCMVIEKFQNDEIGSFVKEDPMLLEYGMYLHKKAESNIEKKLH